MVKKNQLGVGAKCSVLIKYLHPSPRLAARFQNTGPADRLHDLLVTRKGKQTINHVKKAVILFRHDEFPNAELYCCPKFAKVAVEGPPSQIFALANGSVNIGNNDRQIDQSGSGEAKEEIPHDVFHVSGVREDLALMESMGFQVDDDNVPAPENVPLSTNEENADKKATWG